MFVVECYYVGDFGGFGFDVVVVDLFVVVVGGYCVVDV